MLNKELVLEVLRQLEESAQKVVDRFQIKNFYHSTQMLIGKRQRG